MNALRWIFVLFVLLAGAALAVPYVTGGWTEAAYRHQLAEMNQPNLSAINSNYRRGWFSSEATTSIQVSTPGGPEQFYLRHVIEHGPNPTLFASSRITTTLDLPPEHAEVLESLFGTDAPLKAVTTVEFDGKSSTLIEAAPINTDVTNRQGKSVHVRWGGMRGTLQTPGNGETVDVDLTMQPLSVNDGETAMNMQPLTIKAKLTAHGNGLWTGDSRMQLASLEMQGMPDVGSMTLNNMVIISSQNISGVMANGSGSLDIDSLQIAGVNVSKIGYAVRVENLDADALAELQKTVNDLAAREATPMPDFTPLQSQLFSLLNHQPEFAIDRFHFTSDFGEMRGNLRIKYLGSANDLQSNQAPQQLLTLFDAEFGLQAGKELVRMGMRGVIEKQVQQQVAAMSTPPTEAEVGALAEQMLEQQLAMLQMQNFIVDDGSNYTTRMSLRGGQLSINGRVANELLGVMPATP